MSSSARRAGLCLVLLYTAVALLTARLGPGPFRPLFDGFAPPEPYRWVKPPPEFARDNKPPAEGERDVPLGPEGSEVTNTTTTDAQAIASMEVGAVPSHPPDTAVRLRLVPVDSGSLAPLPAGVVALSNAYHVTLTYQPSGTAVTQLARDGTVALTGSVPGDRMLYSADGTAWEERPSRPFGATHGRFSALSAPGYYLVAGPPPAPRGDDRDDDSSGPRGLLLVLLAALPIAGAAFVLRPPPPIPAAPSSGKGHRRPATPGSRQTPGGNKRKRR